MPACGAATASTVGAVAAGVSAATGLASGIAKLASSGDDRPSLGGSGTLGGGAANTLAGQYFGKPLSGSGGPSSDMLGKIEQNMGVIGQRLNLPSRGGGQAGPPMGPPGMPGPMANRRV